MPSPTVAQIMDAIAATLEPILGESSALGEDGFQITGRLNLSPSEPTIDVYPADPFVTPDGAGFGEVGGALNFTVRARVAGDADGRQDLILQLMDEEDALSLAAAIEDDPTLNGTVDSLAVEGPSGFTQYVDGGGSAALLGCEFRVMVLRARS